MASSNINPLAPGRRSCDIEAAFFDLNPGIDILNIICEIALR